MPSAPTSTSPATSTTLAVGAALEARHHIPAALLEADQPVAGLDAVRAQPLEGRLVEHALELAAMDADLRHVVAGVEAPRLAPRPSGRAGS